MVNRKKRKARPTEAPTSEKSTPAPANGAEAAMFGELLSMPGYFSVVGVHTTLWVFVAFYLPRTTFLVDLAGLERGESQVSSRDRPQHPFLTPLTASPASTLLYICIGGIILQSWWAEWMRDWWLQLGLKGTEEENRTEKAFYDRQKLTVRDSHSMNQILDWGLLNLTLDLPERMDSDLCRIFGYSRYSGALRSSSRKVPKVYLWKWLLLTRGLRFFPVSQAGHIFWPF